MQEIMMEFNTRFDPVSEDELDSSSVNRRFVVDIVMMFPSLFCVLCVAFNFILPTSEDFSIENGRIFWTIVLVLNFIATCVTITAFAVGFRAKSESPDIVAGISVLVNSTILIFTLAFFLSTFS